MTDGAFEDALRLVDPKDRVGAAGVIDLDFYGDDVAVDLVLEGVDLLGHGPSGHFIVQVKHFSGGTPESLPRTFTWVTEQLRSSARTPFEVFASDLFSAAARTWDRDAVSRAAADYVLVAIDPARRPHEAHGEATGTAEPRLRVDLEKIKKFLRRQEPGFLVDQWHADPHHELLRWRMELGRDPEQPSLKPSRTRLSDEWVPEPVDKSGVAEGETVEYERPRPRTLGMVRGTPPDYASRHKDYRRGGPKR